MSILVEFFTVIVRPDCIHELYPGGIESFKTINGSFRTDGKLAAIGFMDHEGVGELLSELAGLGFDTQLNSNYTNNDLAIADPYTGLHYPCFWLEYRRRPSGWGECWLTGTEPNEVVGYQGWKEVR